MFFKIDFTLHCNCLIISNSLFLLSESALFPYPFCPEMKGNSGINWSEGKVEATGTASTGCNMQWDNRLAGKNRQKVEARVIFIKFLCYYTLDCGLKKTPPLKINHLQWSMKSILKNIFIFDFSPLYIGLWLALWQQGERNDGSVLRGRQISPPSRNQQRYLWRHDAHRRRAFLRLLSSSWMKAKVDCCHQQTLSAKSR